jgi:CPA1 family monovalent cation:H+ antiporter
MPQRELSVLKAPILLMATGLVAATVLAVGAAAHALLPFLSWPLCFVLAAVLSPTDAAAFGALIAGRSLPARMLRILEGEALVNDASGLVAVKLSLAAVSSTFSPWTAGTAFLAMAGGGIAVGAACSGLLVWLQRRLTGPDRVDGNLAGVLLELLSPFLPYLVAERVGASGVLAVVAAGFVASAMRTRAPGLSVSHMHAQAICRLANYVLDGLVFLLLGMQLVRLVRTPPQAPGLAGAGLQHDLKLYAASAGIALALLLVRFAWIIALGCLAGRRKAPGVRRQPQLTRDSVRLAAVGALAGVRGAVSMAAALGLPYLLPGGEPLPARALVVFLCAGAIVASVCAPSLLLPRLLRRPRGELALRAPLEERWARRRTLRAALATLDQPRTLDLFAGVEALARVRHEYHERLTAAESWLPAAPLEQEVRLRLRALAAQRSELVRLRLNHRINDVTFQSLSTRVDFDEVYLRRR